MMIIVVIFMIDGFFGVDLQLWVFYECVFGVMLGGNSCYIVVMDLYFIYVVLGQGCCVKDVEGEECVDFVNNYMLLIFGYLYFEVIDVVVEVICCGMVFLFFIEYDIRFVEFFVD